MVIVYRNRTIADAVSLHISRTPDLPEGIGKTWMWYDPTKPENSVAIPDGADGRCITEHPFALADRTWLETRLQAWISAGDVEILDKKPEDWVDKSE